MENKKKPKERRRSNEKRKEKSRDAARCRRSKETDIFGELAAALPIPTDQAANLDKASIMRLAIAYLKVRSVIDESAIDPVVETNNASKMSSLFPDALNGFMLVLSSNGDMVYLSENVDEYLGVSQIELMGQSVFEYSHPCDHAEIRECLSIKTTDIDKLPSCNFFLRLKCTLTNKGRKVNLKSASYKVIHCIGRPMMIKEAIQSTDNNNDLPNSDTSASVSCSEDSQDCTDNININNQSTGICLVVVGCPIPHPSNIEVPLGHDTILSKHNLNMKFTYVDERLSEYLGWSNNDLVGKSVFEFYHALDNSALDKSLKSLFSKGQCETMAYRFLNKTGGFVWVVTQATLIRCTKQQKPVSVVCVNYILSGVECKDEIYSIRQLEATNDKQLITSNNNNNNNNNKIEKILSSNIEDKDIENINPKIINEIRTRPLSVTASIFKDRVPDKKIITNDNTNVNDKKDNKRTTNLLQQDKLIIDYDTTILRNRSSGNRPQAVTRTIFCQDNQLSGRPQTTTASIFAPRTEDMSKGFLTFSEDQPGLTMLKDEPEDLTHLAPTPGDVCVPLEDTPFISDMLDEFILGNEVYCPLLSPSLPAELNDDVDLINDDNLKNTNNNIINTTTTTAATTIADGDPFFYADNDSNTNCCLSNSDGLLTPILDKSPEQHSIDSLYSHDDNSNGIGSGISDDDMLMLNINDVIADEELALRAPYIPMSDQDEALQLLISDDMVMWGPTQPPEKKTKWDHNEDNGNTKKFTESSLAKLLKGTSDDIDKRNIESYNVDQIQVLGQNCKKGTNKRHHGTMLSVTENDKKRIRYQDTSKLSSPIISNDIYSIDMSTVFTGSTATTTTNKTEQNNRLILLNDDDDNDKINNNELRMENNKIILEQMMEKSNKKTTINTPIDKKHERNNNNHQEEKEDEDADDGGGDYDGGGIKFHDDTKKQSNSVLMNLLVSGCDKTCINLPRNYSPLKITTEDPFVYQDGPLSSPYLTNMTINQDSQCIKNIEDLTSSLLINNSSFIDDDFNYNIDTGPLSPGSELLQVLGQAN